MIFIYRYIVRTYINIKVYLYKTYILIITMFTSLYNYISLNNRRLDGYFLNITNI